MVLLDPVIDAFNMEFQAGGQKCTEYVEASYSWMFMAAVDRLKQCFRTLIAAIVRFGKLCDCFDASLLRS
jgi:hypothetical protein